MKLAAKIFLLWCGLTLIGFAQQKPDPPTVSNTPSEKSVTFRFNAVTNGTFDVKVAADDKMRNVVGSGSTTSTSLTINGLTGSTTYYFEATVTVSGKTSNATPGSFKTSDPPVQKPYSPTNLSATTATTAVTLSWNSVAGATKYEWEVYYMQTLALAKAGETTTPVAVVGGLPAATDFTWRVRALNSAGASDWSSAGEKFTTPIGKPKEPSSLDASPTPDGASLSWSGVSEAKSYDVQILEASTFGTVQNKNVSGTSTSVSGLSSNTKYYAQVRSVNDGGTSDWIQKSFTTLRLPAPSGLSVTPTATGVTLTWGSVTGAKSYVVEIHDKSNYRSLVKSASPTSTTVTIAGLTGDQDYYWQVKAVDAGGEGAWAQSQFKTLSQAPTVPTALSSIPTSSDVALSWAPASRATSYVVEVHDKPNYRSLFKTATVSTTSATITGLAGDQTYYWQVKSVGAGGESNWAQAQFTTLKAIAAPTVTFKEAANSVTFTFTAVSGGSLYEVKLFDKPNNGTLQGSGSTTDPTKSVVIGSLKSKEKYYYEATMTVSGQVSQAATGSFTTLDASTLPPAPEVTVEKTTNTATFTFKEVSGATLYEVRLYDKQNTTNATPIDRGSTTDPTKPVAFTNLTSKQKYYYEATVTVGTQTSEPSKGDFTTDEIPPQILFLLQRAFVYRT